MATFPNLRTGCILAASLLFCLGATANATTYTYDLTVSYADQNGSGSDLTPTGGTRDGSGYHWSAVDDANEGLTLANVIGAGNPYKIEIKFSFDETDGWRRILDFKDRADDSGFYNYYTSVQLYPNAVGPGGAFANGTPVDLVITRGPGGVVNVWVDGNLQISDPDSVNQYADFTGTSIVFFMDNNGGSFYNEVSGGTATFIQITTGETPLPAALPLFASGLGAMGLVGWRRRRMRRVT